MTIGVSTDLTLSALQRRSSRVARRTMMDRQDSSLLVYSREVSQSRKTALRSQVRRAPGNGKSGNMNWHQLMQQTCRTSENSGSTRVARSGRAPSQSRDGQFRSSAVSEETSESPKKLRSSENLLRSLSLRPSQAFPIRN